MHSFSSVFWFLRAILYDFNVEYFSAIGLEEVFNLDFSVLNINSENVTLTWRGSYNVDCNFSYVLIEWSLVSECNNSLFTLYNSSDNSIVLPRMTTSGGDVKFNISLHADCPPSAMTEMILAVFRCECVVAITNTLSIVNNTF